MGEKFEEADAAHGALLVGLRLRKFGDSPNRRIKRVYDYDCAVHVVNKYRQGVHDLRLKAFLAMDEAVRLADLVTKKEKEAIKIIEFFASRYGETV